MMVMYSWKGATTLIKPDAMTVTPPASPVVIFAAPEMEPEIWATISVTLFKAACKPALAVVMTCRASLESPWTSPAILATPTSTVKALAKKTAKELTASRAEVLTVAIVATTDAATA